MRIILIALILSTSSVIADDPVKDPIAEPIQFQIRSKAVEWDPPAGFEDGTPISDSIRYRVYWGPTSRAYTDHVATSNLTAEIPINSTGVWYVAATALVGNRESRFSDELVIPINRPAPPGGLRVAVNVRVTVEVDQP